MAILAVLTGVYPAFFAFVPSVRGLFTTKSEVLLNSSWYIPVFMIHIGFGAFALLSGCTQFFEKFRKKRMNIHRFFGKIYVISVLLSGLSGLLVGFYATGEWYSKAGFICLALGWLITTVIAYKVIREKKYVNHRNWMMRSYAFCFPFVTFRIYLGIGVALQIPFYDYYSYLSFLCWVPNIFFIEYIIKTSRLD